MVTALGQRSARRAQSSASPSSIPAVTQGLGGGGSTVTSAAVATSSPSSSPVAKSPTARSSTVSSPHSSPMAAVTVALASRLSCSSRSCRHRRKMTVEPKSSPDRNMVALKQRGTWHRLRDWLQGGGTQQGEDAAPSCAGGAPGAREETQRLLAAANIPEEQLNPFQVLGVEATASDAELRRAYRRLAVLVHPDKNEHPRAEAAFKVLRAAWDIVSSPERRREYELKRLAEQELSRSVGVFLSRLQDNLRDAMNTMMCSKCRGKHKRFELERDPLSARYCAECGGLHPAEEGDFWAESSLLGLKITYLAMMEGKIYDITEWAGCQRVGSHLTRFSSPIGRYACRSASPRSRRSGRPIASGRCGVGGPWPILAELKQECLARGLEAKGNKQDLIQRLQAYLEEHAEEEANEEDVLGEEIEEEEQKPLEPPAKAEEPPVKSPDLITEKKVVKITSEISQMELLRGFNPRRCEPSRFFVLSPSLNFRNLPRKSCSADLVSVFLPQVWFGHSFS
ncbi:putative LOC102089028 [Columba livia]|uniref:SAP domain-containing ribonucleoprotein n=1 Tax=Columba livia TaxID=8932 RepID=A0A2I0LJ95_COLLI|nr:putative LOC102089028 [Columba livia]